MNRSTRIAGMLTVAAAVALTGAGCASGSSEGTSLRDVSSTSGTIPTGVPATPAPTTAPAPVPVTVPVTVGRPGEPAPSEVSTQVLPAALSRIVVADASGNVRVTGADVTAVTITRKIFLNPTRPTEQVTTTGGVLQITAPQCATDDGPVPCRIDYEIQAPRGTAVTLTGASGNLALAGLTGPQSAVSASGDVDVTGSTGPLEARSVSGDVDVVATAVRERLVAASQSGNTDVVVPPGAYRVEASTVSGDGHVGLADTPTAPVSVQVSSVSGNIHLGTVARSDGE